MSKEFREFLESPKRKKRKEILRKIKCMKCPEATQKLCLEKGYSCDPPSPHFSLKLWIEQRTQL